MHIRPSFIARLAALLGLAAADNPASMPPPVQPWASRPATSRARPSKARSVKKGYGLRAPEAGKAAPFLRNYPGLRYEKGRYVERGTGHVVKDPEEFHRNLMQMRRTDSSFSQAAAGVRA